MVSINLNRFNDLVELFEYASTEYAKRPFSTHMGSTITYADLYQKSEKFARVLQHSFSIKPGDRVAIMLPNIFQHHVALFGCILAGAVVVCVNPMYTFRELNHQLVDSGAKILVGLDVFTDIIQRGIEVSDVEAVIMCSLGDLLGVKGVALNWALKYIKKKIPDSSIDCMFRFSKLMKSQVTDLSPLVDRSPNRLALLQYTGGTTGVSKGAMLSHTNIVSNIEQCLSVSVYLEKNALPKKVLCALPLFHIYALTSVCFLGLRRGDHLILVHNPREIDQLISALKSYKPNVLPLINTLFAQLARHPDIEKIDFSYVDYCLSGGMAQQRHVTELWYEKTGTVIHQGYGLSETSPVVSICLENALVDHVGCPLPMTDIKMRHLETGKFVKPGEVGEICIKGPQVMLGYWNRPAETSQVFQGGWLRTGDIGYLNDYGNLVINDRLKDMVIINGFNVYPNEVETVLANSGLIEEAAVVGVMDQSGREYLIAYLVAAREAISVKEVLDYCKKHLVYYKVPRLVSFVDGLPKTAVGKVCRRELRGKKIS